MLLFISEYDLNIINGYNGSTLAKKKNKWIADTNTSPDYSKLDHENALCYNINGTSYSIFSKLENLRSCAGMFANTSIIYGDSNHTDWAPFNEIYENSRLGNGLKFDDAKLFENNPNLEDISMLFANSVYYTNISDNFLKRCEKLKYAQELFRNNYYQESLPTTNMFNSCRNSLLYANSLFEGCISLTGNMCTGNDPRFSN